MERWRDEGNKEKGTDVKSKRKVVKKRKRETRRKL